MHHARTRRRTRSQRPSPKQTPTSPQNNRPQPAYPSPRDPRASTHKYTPPIMADATNASDELYPIAVLIDELKVWR